MNKVIYNVNLILIFVFCISIYSCATTPTKPNLPYLGANPLLDEISKKNTLLGIELRKMPELKDGISPEENEALKRLVKLYNDDPDVFNSAFEEMYQEGLPDVRRYCTPLQALFWLVEDDKIDLAKASIRKYELMWILIYAWSDKKKERWRNYNNWLID